MISTVYVEHAVLDHARTARVLGRLPRAHVVEIDRYGEVFNRGRQDFRVQKRNPSLILAQKEGERVLPTPEGYGVGGARNFYFSHMLNCLYDCRYCFLQGMFRSAHQVLFVDYEPFWSDIAEIASQSADDTWFFSGYDCDSLAFEGISGFATDALDAWADLPPNAFLELRTKSTHVEGLLARKPDDRVVVAYSLSPAAVAREVEHGTPSLERRIDALARLQDAGWKVGLRFDPLLYRQDFAASYEELFQQVFDRIDGEAVHSASLGVFRLPKDFHRRLIRLYPDEPLLAMPFAEGTGDQAGMISYRRDLERELFEGVRARLLEHIEGRQYFPLLS